MNKILLLVMIILLSGCDMSKTKDNLEETTKDIQKDVERDLKRLEKTGADAYKILEKKYIEKK